MTAVDSNCAESTGNEEYETISSDAVMKMALDSSDQPSSNDQQLTCGDLVVHSTKQWPWIGTIAPKVTDFARLCNSCGGLKVLPSEKDGDTQYKIRIEGQEGPAPLCESHEDSPALQDSGIGTTGRYYTDDDEQYNADPICCHHMPKSPPIIHGADMHQFIPHTPDDMIPPPLLALSAEGATSGRHFQVNWYPTGEVTDMDGGEKVVVPFKLRSLFQEGNPVAREGALTSQGLVKQVHRRLDAFVLPDYKWVVTDLPGSKLKPLMDIEQCPGCFVIYKGWVGTVYNVWHRITFRMDDGTEFVLSDDQGEIGAHMREEIGKTPCADIYHMYPGLKVKIRWMLLDTAKWPNGYVIPEGIEKKIQESRDRWNATETYDPICPDEFVSSPPPAHFHPINPMPEVQSGVENGPIKVNAETGECAEPNHQKSTITMDGAKVDQAKMEYMAMVGPMRWGGHMRIGQFEPPPAPDDMVSVTVVKLEPFKIDVEWLSQVISDTAAGPKGNVIEGDDLKEAYIFRSSHMFEPYDLGVRYRYIIQPEDKLVPASVYRQHLINGTVDASQFCETDSTEDTSPPPSVGDCVYVAIGKSSSKIDILWETGSFEKGVEPDGLSAQYSNHPERDYFPAMYVALQTDNGTGKNHGKDRSGREKSDSGMEEPVQAAEGENESGSTCPADYLLTKFGVVKKAKNSEKYATVAWHEMKRKLKDTNGAAAAGEWEEDPVFLNEEDVSFYDLKFYHEFNYIGGTLVSRIDSSSLPSGMPNVGYVLRKNPDASVQVVWYDGSEEKTKPWKLRQLILRYASEYTPSDVGDEPHYYSPTEHECEDLEDLRYYDYTLLPVDKRLKRIGLIVTIMREVALRLCSLTVTLDNYLPYADRKKLVKFTLSCNDVCNAFANLNDFRDTIKEMFENEQKEAVAVGTMQANETSSNGNAGAPHKLKLFKGRYIREERLVWQCANWLYDWTEAMTTLQEDMRRYRNKILRKESGATEGATSTGNTGTPAAEPTSAATSTAGEPEKGNQDQPDWVNYVSDLQSTIEVGLSTVSGILSVPNDSDVSGGIVVDYLKSLENISSPVNFPTLVSSIDQFATFNSSHNFLRALVENPAKLGRLPCFSYNRHSELELSALAKKWPISGENATVVQVQEGEKGPKSCQNILDEVNVMIEDVLHGRKDVSYTDDDVLKLCNETADGLCLSVLSIMVKMIDSVYNKLRPQIESSLNETKENENMGQKKSESDESVEEDGVGKVKMNEEEAKTKQEKTTSGENKNGSIANGVLIPEIPSSSFELLPNAPPTHRFISKQFDASIMPKTFLSAVRREIKLLHSSLPPGIFVKTYEDRLDLISCMIIGPQGTPYADGVFFFDVRLKDDYPTRPPHLFFKSMSKLLNPNLYEDGMVCLSLLGTWDGKETELWTSNSTLLQVFISIQSLILVPEPYFNEPGFEKEKGSQTGATRSRDYNEAAVLRTLESLQRAMNDPPEPFREEMRQHILNSSERLSGLLEKYQDPQGDNAELSFPLFPVTQGFCLCIKRHAENLRRLSERWTADAL